MEQKRRIRWVFHSTEDDRTVSGSKNNDPKYRPNLIFIDNLPRDVVAKDFA